MFTMENKVISMLKVLLSSLVAYRYQAAFCHWNVEGPDFIQYHSFFETLYKEADAYIDLIAEQIRTLDAYAPGSFSRFSELSKVEELDTIKSPKEYCNSLLKSISVLKSLLAKLHTETETNYGLQSIVDEFQSKLDKNAWMLKVISK